MKKSDNISLLDPTKTKYVMREKFYNKYTFVLLALLVIVFYYGMKTKPEEESPHMLRLRALQKWSDQKLSLIYRNPVDSLDGRGFDFNKHEKMPIDPRYEELNKLPQCDLTKDPEQIVNNVTKIVDAFHDCIKPIVRSFIGSAHKMTINWVEKTKVCDNLPEFQNLRIEEFKNAHETKWTILPKCKEENNLVTLGVGHDTLAEERLNVTLPQTNFYGADPIIEPNLQLYSAFGKFFPFAIGREGGMARFRILPNQNQKTRRYLWQDVTTIDFVYFLNNVLKMKKIDFAWIDIEGGEFQFIDMLNNGGPLDEKGINICQFNIEMHSQFVPSGEVIFHDFILEVLRHRRWIFLKPMKTDRAVFRMFFINMENEECIRKFIL